MSTGYKIAEQDQLNQYAYTLQGWVKAMNSAFLEPVSDIGLDGLDDSSLPNRKVARDVSGYVIGYLSKDFMPVSTTNLGYDLIFDPMDYEIVTPGNPLYNGNIAQIWTDQVEVDTNNNYNFNKNSLLYLYRYDQLQRLKDQSAVHATFNVDEKPTLNYTNEYFSHLDYDANGNITNLSRKGFVDNPGGIAMDSLEYYYYSGTNRVERIKEYQPYDTLYQCDLDSAAGRTANYKYDATGHLILDKSENSLQVTWNLANKPVNVSNNQNPSLNLNYYYDPSGNRVVKYDGSKTLVYIRDASGNILCTYEKKNDNISHSDTAIVQREIYLYGSSRLGVWYPDRSWSAPTSRSRHNKNQREYEITNHLGNIMATISDHKTGIDSDSNTYVNTYEPVIRSTQDYYPGGMLMPGRSYSSNSYRFGMNGQEKDDEIAGNGSIYSAQYWEYDSRSIRRWNLDPKCNTWESPYACFAGNPIWNGDPLGDKVINAHEKDKEKAENRFNTAKSAYEKLKEGDKGYKKAKKEFERAQNNLNYVTEQFNAAEAAITEMKTNQSDLFNELDNLKIGGKIIDVTVEAHPTQFYAKQSDDPVNGTTEDLENGNKREANGFTIPPAKNPGLSPLGNKYFRVGVAFKVQTAEGTIKTLYHEFKHIFYKVHPDKIEPGNTEEYQVSSDEDKAYPKKK